MKTLLRTGCCKVGLVLTVGTILCLAGCDFKVIIIAGADGMSINLVKNSSPGSANDRVIGALVAPDDVTITDAAFKMNGSSVAIDQTVSQALKDKLQQELVDAGYYDASWQQIVYYRTTNTIISDGTGDLEITFRPCLGTVFAFAGGLETDLNGCTLGSCESVAVVQQHQGPCPTLSQWGIGVMALLVLTAGTVVMSRSRRAAVV